MKNFFNGLSFSQLLAGALAAVTSFLLSSKIGIAGSVIGVAVASIVSTSASQIYKNVIDASSKKLQDAAAQQLGEKDGRQEGTSDASDDTQTITPVGRPAQERGRKGRVVASNGAGASTSGKAPAKPAPSGPQLTGHDKRVAIVVAVVSGLVAVAVTAGVILALTGGRGTDSVVHDIVSPSVTSEEGGDVSPAPSQSVITPTPEPSASDTASTPSTDDRRQDGGSDTKDDQGSNSPVVEPSATPSPSQSAGTGDGSQSAGTGDGSQNGGSTDDGQEGTTTQGDSGHKDDTGQQTQ
ncbi:hypothetical protein [Bifidobacterium choerinum]|uniref:Uncharacterized protein n=1 Tax=Bifidobacterium choerinum TaxID=35760 RepID=A0A087AEY1_9BIFI|nr:hypothetical protein [Bifidobacterium choerinum]ATU20560.1 hypothetical protein BcFMB_06105 [Bifidobacterium choerinum]KFI57331.1 hypothetical protein BCHO_0749 [Bifidobacterium choerinum]